ncbi:flagellar biosynthetic protein FliQ [Hydrogenibacillus schlegelii]|uniref:Flagellar biosynthetic protein FliQ n=1 Tax=Hydrogenibacillus schlegelii TaxID=1484 RepID=A0A132ND76_HYDSH|nr:flagellar biosynthetic protein FliQ [Hydrogenibacillus schlegelii]KWX08054.1 hypothetical protein TR75_01425 [Hydrogenibacillus schlegelii]OAR04712.1 hypothetical protein SA87_09335 [Hydrogenibacillus schlegelii]
MSAEMGFYVVGQAVWTVLRAIAWPLGAGLLVGLVVSLLMATTQIQEQTLAFIPKIVAVLVALVVFGQAIFGAIVDFARLMFELARGAAGG